MRKTLLIAAAALAASIISSQAQVYSQNIVGYANVPTPGASVSYLLSVPFLIGGSNGINEVFGTSLQGAADFTQILIWNPTGPLANTFTVYNTDSTTPSGWDDVNTVPLATPPNISVGQGYFLIPAAANLDWVQSL